MENSEAKQLHITHAEHAPSLTIGIPVLNEEAHIKRVIDGFLETGYPNLIEILIADGGSTDRTREIVRGISAIDKRVKLVENPDKYQSYALNRMIDLAKGEVFLRADAHCDYAEDYVEKCAEHLVKTGARNAGGAQRYKAGTKVQAGISLAVRSYLGNGGAKYMDHNYQGYADTVFLGCFWTDDLKKVQGYSVDNITNEDAELNIRLIKTFGKESVFISPEIKIWYYPRDSFLKLFKQYLRYGRGRFLTIAQYPLQSPLRGLLPFLFALIFLMVLLISLVTKTTLITTWILVIVLALISVESARTVIKNKNTFTKEIWKGEDKEPSFFSRFINTVVSIIVMQLAYFSGFSFQLFKRLFLFRKGW